MPATSNEQILDRYIRHQTYLLRYVGGLRNEVLPELVNTEEKLHNAIIKWINRVNGNRTLTGTSGRKWQREFAEAINRIRGPAWDKISNEVSSQLKELAVSEAAIGASIIESSLPVVIGLAVPPASKLVGIVNSQPFQGRTLKQWLEKSNADDVQRILNAAKIGIVQGQTPTQIAREVVGTKNANYRDGVARTSFNDIESELLTVTNGIQNEVKQALYAENSDIIKKELYVATLDGRTTITCMGFDGQIFPRGKGPIPPLHFRCRSVRVPSINPSALRNRGFDSSLHGNRALDDEIGQVPAKTSYNEWLKNQTNAFQDQVLGKTRAKLFRKNKISLDKFIARDGDVLSLSQLRAKGFEIPGD